MPAPTFQTSFPNRYLFRAAAGDGIYGCCAGEFISIADGATRPNDSHPSFNAFLRSFVIQVNDMRSDDISPAERSDALFPILPALFGSKEAEAYLKRDIDLQLYPDPMDMTRFPRLEFLEAVGLPPVVLNPWGMMTEAARVVDEDGAARRDFYKGIEVLKTAFVVFWEQVEMQGGPSPQEDYTSEQIDRVHTYLDTLPTESELYGPIGKTYILRNYKGGS